MYISFCNRTWGRSIAAVDSFLKRLLMAAGTKHRSAAALTFLWRKEHFSRLVNLARMVRAALHLQFLDKSTWQEKKHGRPYFGRTHQDPKAKWTRVASSIIINEPLVATSENKVRERRQWNDHPKTMTAGNMKTERQGWRLQTKYDEIWVTTATTPKYWRRLCQPLSCLVNPPRGTWTSAPPVITALVLSGGPLWRYFVNV